MKFKSYLFLLFNFFASVSSASELGSLSSEQLIAMQKKNDALVIDIRTEKEWDNTGTIPNSHTLQFFSASGKYDADKWLSQLNKLKTSSEQPIILVCRSGKRSGMVGNMLTNKLNIKNIYHLSSGITSWIKAGNDVDKKNCLTTLACK